jgi:hypothetical protein
MKSIGFPEVESSAIDFVVATKATDGWAVKGGEAVPVGDARTGGGA